MFLLRFIVKVRASFIYIKDGKIFGECDLGKFEQGNIERTEKFDQFIKEMGW